jgi:TPR repeat protein
MSATIRSSDHASSMIVRTVVHTVMVGVLATCIVHAQEPPLRRDGDPILCDPSTHAPPRRPNAWKPIRDALLAHDFTRLEALLAELRKSPREPRSYWNRWSETVADLGNSVWLDHLDAWCAAKPQSSVALTVRGRARVRWAWKARGGGRANTVSDEGWRVFGERLQLAKADLERAAALDRKNFVAPSFLIRVAMGLNLDRAQAQRYLDQAVAAAEPQDIDHYEKFVTYLLPKWHGEEGDALRFARELADRKGADPAMNVVAIIAHKQLCEHLELPEQRRYFERVRDEMDRRYMAVLTAYPDAIEAWRGRAEFFEALDDDKEVNRARARCVELDDADSMVRRGRCFDRGLLGLTPDPVRAVRLYCRAAWLGNSGANAELAAVLLEGKSGVPVDTTRGLVLLREAFDAKQVHAIFYMGRALHEGAFGLEKDVARGRQLVEAAAEEGHIEAAGLLGRWLYVEGHVREGLLQLQTAATNDDGPSMLLMGQIVGLGRALGGPPVQPVPKLGARYLRWAVAKSQAGARESLVELLRRHPEERVAGDP